MALATLFMMATAFRSCRSKKPAPVRHYFNTPAPAGHVPDESEIPYWL